MLVVDDNVDAAESLGEVLRDEVHEVAIAHDSTGVFELAAGSRPDLAFLDIGLPVMDGYEVARRLRQSSGDRALAIAEACAAARVARAA